MSKQGPDKISWAHETVNPITGCALKCMEKCYAAAIAKRFPHVHKVGVPFTTPVFHPERLKKFRKFKPGQRIFVGSMCDLFSPGAEGGWVNALILAMEKAPRVHFQLLTKNPEYGQWDFPTNAWLGVSVTCSKDLWRWKKLASVKHPCIRWINIGPALGKPEPNLKQYFKDVGLPDWVAFEAISVGKKAEKIWSAQCLNKWLVLFKDLGVPVFVKGKEFKGYPQEYPV